MINKILFTIFAIIAIWKAFSMISRLTQQNKGGVTKAAEPKARVRPGEPKAVEMRPCPRCGAYVDPREGCSCSTSAA